MFTADQESRLTRVFSKGHTMDSFQYDSNFKVQKDGKYVKEQLSKQKESIENELREYQNKLAQIQAKLPQDCQPDTEPSSYVFEGIRKSAFDSYPKMFSYEKKKKYMDQSGGGYGKELSPYPSSEEINDTMTTYQLMCKYNECARMVIGHKADLLWLDMLKDTIKDNQKIELNGKMLKLMI